MGEDLLPLCVDLDNTFLKTDTLIEAVVKALIQKPLRIFTLLRTLLMGKAAFKAEVSKMISSLGTSLPTNQELLGLLQVEHARGRPLYLVTGAHQSIANSIREEYPIFKEAHGSSDTLNLTEENKANFLVTKLGPSGFDYIGDSKADISVWQQARSGWIVSHRHRFIAAIQKRFPEKNLQVIQSEKNTLSKVFKLMRVSQWSKNLLVFVPLVLAQQWNDSDKIIEALGAFFGFSALASFIYILNDLSDLQNDRLHPAKKLRPLAAGDVTLSMGIMLMGFLLLLALAIGASLPMGFAIFALGYLALNCLYSFKLKKVLVLDAFVLASFYSLRLLAGSGAVEVEISHWLIIFSTFFFLSLGFLKRYSDLLFVAEKAGQTKLDGRGYHFDDRQLLMTAGIVSGFVSILVFALYIYGSESVHYYHRPKFLWGVLFCMLYWITKIWFKGARGLVQDDPVKYALRDKESLILGASTMIFLILAAWA